MLEPKTPLEFAAELKRANAAGRAVAPRGGGTKSDWGNPASRCDAILSTARLNRVVEHAWSDLTVTVEAGCTLANLQATLAEHGQRLAIDALWPERATVGGILSTNDSGALRLRFGGLRDLIIGATVALADGTLAMSGGKVVKNVAGYDLPKLVTGALGTLGVITQAIFRVHPLPLLARTRTLSAVSLLESQKMVLAIQASQLAHTSLQLRWDGSECETDIVFEGTEAGIAAQEGTVLALGEALPGGIWKSRADLEICPTSVWEKDGAVLKIAVLPTEISRVVALLGAESAAVFQATGIGLARVKGTGEELLDLRAVIEKMGGSMVVLRQSAPGIEAWGTPGDALPLMQALKRQFDPKGTINPGRFVGGI